MGLESSSQSPALGRVMPRLPRSIQQMITENAQEMQVPGGKKAARVGWVILTGCLLWDSPVLLLADRRSFGLIAL